MADEDIVQKVVITVDDTALAKAGDDAKQSFAKMKTAAADAGQSLAGVQAAAGTVGAGAQKLGVGLADVTAKTIVTTKEMRSLGTVMRAVGEGEMAGAAVGFVRIGAALGPIGVGLFALAEAFKYLKGRMEEADKAAKATITSMATLAKVSTEMHQEDIASYYHTTTAALRETANEAGHVADQYRNLRQGAKEIITDDTKAGLKGFITLLEQSGISVDDVAADTKKLGEASYKAGLEAAKLYEKMSPIQKLNFEEVLKSAKFPDDVIASIEKGSAAFKQAHDQAARPFFGPEQQASIDNLMQAWDLMVAASKRVWAQIAGDAETGAKGWAQTWSAAVATGFADAMAWVGKFEHYVLDVFNKLVAAAKALWSALSGSGANVSAPAAGGAGGMAAGGEVGGAPGVDANLAYLSRGEFVLSAAAVAKYGTGFLHNLNRMLVPRFAAGGLVGATAATGSVASSRAVHLHFDTKAFGPMTASEDVAGALERFAVHSQLARIGRSQSWRK